MVPIELFSYCVLCDLWGYVCCSQSQFLELDKFQDQTFTRCLKLLRIPRPRTMANTGLRVTSFPARSDRRGSEPDVSRSRYSVPVAKSTNSLLVRHGTTGELFSLLGSHPSAGSWERHADSLSLGNDDNTDSATASSILTPKENTPDLPVVASIHSDDGSSLVAANSSCPDDGSGGTNAATHQPQAQAPIKVTATSDLTVDVAATGDGADSQNPVVGGEVAVALTVEPDGGRSAVTAAPDVTTRNAINTATVSSLICKVDAASSISTTSKTVSATSDDCAPCNASGTASTAVDLATPCSVKAPSITQPPTSPGPADSVGVSRLDITEDSFDMLNDPSDGCNQQSLSLEDMDALTKGILCHAPGNVPPRKSIRIASPPSRRANSPRKPLKNKSFRRSSFNYVDLVDNPANDIVDPSSCVAECFLVCGVDRLSHPVGLQPQLLHCYPKHAEPVTDLTGVSTFVFPFGMRVDTTPWTEIFYFFVLTSGTGEFSYMSAISFPERCPPSITAIICCEDLQAQFLKFIQLWVQKQAQSKDKPTTEIQANAPAAEADNDTAQSTNAAPLLSELAFNLIVAIHHTVGKLSMPTLRQLSSQMRSGGDGQGHVQLRAFGSELESLLDELDNAFESNDDKEASLQRKILDHKLVEIHNWLANHLRPLLEAFCTANQIEHLYVSKALVICSENPFYRFFKAFLNEILDVVQAGTAQRQVSLESWISYLTRDVPVPPRGRLALGVRLRPDGPLLAVSLPPPGDLPLLDFDMEIFFRRLPINHVGIHTLVHK